MTCIFQSSTFVDFLREWYGCHYAVEAIGSLNHNHCKGSLLSARLCARSIFLFALSL